MSPPLLLFSLKDLVKVECEEWTKKGIDIRYEVRSNRKGYKAGALKKGMEHHYAKQCDFVAIFDADFQPDSDFLLKTLPFLVHNPEIALVQTRWDFGQFFFILLLYFLKNFLLIYLIMNHFFFVVLQITPFLSSNWRLYLTFVFFHNLTEPFGYMTSYLYISYVKGYISSIFYSPY